MKALYVIKFVEPYSSAAATGICTNDVIVLISSQDVLSLDPAQSDDTIIQTRGRTGRIELLAFFKQSYRSCTKQQWNIF